VAALAGGFSTETPLTVGSPQQVIDRYASMRHAVGHYQRQLFLMDHAGASARDGAGADRDPRHRGGARAAPRDGRGATTGVPDAPTHASLVAARGGAAESAVDPASLVDRWTGTRAEDANRLEVVR
jgi:hypothetical protein